VIFRPSSALRAPSPRKSIGEKDRRSFGEQILRGAETKSTTRARSLRQVNNDAEYALWAELRGRRMNGHKFVRQFPIGKYFADFACREYNLVIELDGSQHADSDYDEKRNQFMNEQGWSVLRFWNADIFRVRTALLDTIVAVLEGRLTGAIVSLDLRYFPARKGI
jgi:very-short-patch-repair endonuclease